MKKIAYLTIDDAPSKDFKRKVDYLLSKNILAIFFCRGELLKQRPKIVIYAIKKGFIIGNHSYNHPYFSRLILKQCFEQIKKTDEIIDKLYKKAEVRRPIKVFRFPSLDKGGKNKKAVQILLKKLGYKQPKFKNITYKWYQKEHGKDIDVYCSYDTYDWTTIDKKPEFGIKGLKEVLERMEEDDPEGCRGLNYKGSNEIIMMHDFTGTAHMFKPMIEHLLAKGIVFKLPSIK
jgi:peptidoglycan/xylan/chitin deacetylase (PgdA/CDA1 family)